MMEGQFLSSEENARYERQIPLASVGEEGQQKLKRSSVLVIGAGGLGSPVLLYLAAAGVGHLGIVDDDVVSLGNLNRQILYGADDLGKPKAACAVARLRALNPHCEVTCYTERLVAANAEKLISQYDLLVDATDNLPTRYLIDEVCGKLSVPFVYGSVSENSGHVAYFPCDGGTSYSDLFPYTPAVEQFEGSRLVLGAHVGIVGSMQAMVALKALLGHPVLAHTLMTIDTDAMNFMKIRV